MDIFDFRNKLIGDYAEYIKSFIRIQDERIHAVVERELRDGTLWPEPLVQLNPFFAPGATIDELVGASALHHHCRAIFRRDKTQDDGIGKPMRLHRHQEDAIRDYVLWHSSGNGIKAIVETVGAIEQKVAR